MNFENPGKTLKNDNDKTRLEHSKVLVLTKIALASLIA